MKNAPSCNTSQAGLRGFGHWTTVALAFVLGLILNIGTAFADEEEPDPCKGVVFSTSDNEEFGCSVAAALHFGGTSLEGVRTYVGKYSSGRRGAKWLQRFNKNLSGLARDTFWASFSHIFSRSDVKDWTDAEFVEKLAESATRLDILHQHRRTDLKVRSLLKATKEVAPTPPPAPKKDCKPAAPPPADPTPPKKVP